MLKNEEITGPPLGEKGKKELSKYTDDARKQASKIEDLFKPHTAVYDLFTYFLTHQLVVNTFLSRGERDGKVDGFTNRLAEIVRQKPQQELQRQFPDKEQDIFKLIGNLRIEAANYYRAIRALNEGSNIRAIEQFREERGPMIRESIEAVYSDKVPVLSKE